MKKALYKFYESFGRMGDIEGLFLSNEEEVLKLENKTQVLYDYLGKHSEIEMTYQLGENITFITDEQVVIDVFEKYSLETGFNPFCYFEDDE